MPTVASLQSGSLTLSSPSSTVSITSVDTSKAALFFSYAPDDAGQPRQEFVAGFFNSATELQFEVQHSSLSGQVEITWHVVEWSDVTVQSGVKTDTSSSVTITSLTVAESFLVFTYDKAGGIAGSDDFHRGYIDSATSLFFDSGTTGSSTATDDLAWFVVEYGSDATVQTGTATMPGGTNSDTATITTVDLDDTFLTLSYTISSNGATDRMTVAGSFNSTTEIQVDRDSTSLDVDWVWQVVELADSVVQSGIEVLASTDLTEQVSITSVDLDAAVPLTSGFHNTGGAADAGSNDSIAPGMAELALAATTLDLTRRDSEGDTDFEWFVVEFGGASGGPATGTGSGSVTFAGTATGQRTGEGTAAGTVPFTGSAAGTRTRQGAAAGTAAFTATAAGARTRDGSATGTVEFTATAAGLRTTQGTAAGAVTFTGAAEGLHTGVGQAAGTATFAGSAEGQRTASRSAAGTVEFTATAAGERTREGSGSGAVSFTGMATGQRTTSATASGAVEFTATATGQVPAGEGEGTGSGAVEFTATATGQRTANAEALGTVTFTAAATGQRTAIAGASGTVEWTASATGQRTAQGVVTAAIVTFTGAAQAVRTALSTAEGAATFTATAAGAIVGGSGQSQEGGIALNQNEGGLAGFGAEGMLVAGRQSGTTSIGGNG